jgi:16S rRNA A1518/A1519 N6-dimethyltransferase RsmA/KsgA/DIM1 with predicted DNA glycosylase/AP lyase activity
VAFDALVETLFQHRRKQLAGGLAELLGRGPADRLVLAAGIDPRTRPESLGSAQLLLLSRSAEWSARATSG